MQRQEFDTLSPYDNFVYALKAKETKRQYPHRLDKFLSFLGIEGTIQQKCNKLYEIGKDVNQFQSRIINFINSQKDRIASNEISEAKLHNCISSLLRFVDIGSITADLMLPSSTYLISTADPCALSSSGKVHQLPFFTFIAQTHFILPPIYYK